MAKAYATRVGAGPFPTELDDDLGDEIRKRGGEFGTTTGRPRRTGWIDLVALRYASRINGMTSLVITKLDVLDGFETLKVCTGYRTAEGAEVDAFPYHQTILHHVTPIYTELPGWNTDITGMRTAEELPEALARLPALHRGGRRRARRAARRRAGARSDRVDRGAVAAAAPAGVEAHQTAPAARSVLPGGRPSGTAPAADPPAPRARRARGRP